MRGGRGRAGSSSSREAELRALRAQRLELYSLHRQHQIGDDVLREVLAPRRELAPLLAQPVAAGDAAEAAQLVAARADQAFERIDPDVDTATTDEAALIYAGLPPLTTDDAAAAQIRSDLLVVGAGKKSFFVATPIHVSLPPRCISTVNIDHLPM